MELLTFITFVGISLGLIATPGPNVLVIVSISISEGKLRAGQTIAGISLAMAVQLFVATLSASWVVNALADGFEFLKWAGVIYLVYLAVREFAAAGNKRKHLGGAGAVGSFAKGFFVSLTNAKTILFFGAFLPQFVSTEFSFTLQITALSLTFWCLALLVNLTYMTLAHRLAARFRKAGTSRLVHVASGSLYLGAAAALSVIRR